MAHDSADGATIQLTHEFLSVMLGVRRAGVTTSLKQLESRGFIVSKRGSIEIKNRDGLKDVAGGSYGIAEAELDLQFPATVVKHSPPVIPTHVGAALISDHGA